jgi:hypothetical protein
MCKKCYHPILQLDGIQMGMDDAQMSDLEWGAADDEEQ